MQLIDGRPVFSATDLVGFLACRSLTELDRAVLAGRARAPHVRDRELEVVQQRGMEHEQRYLEELRGQGRDVVPMEAKNPADYPSRLREEAAATLQAMV